MIEQAQPPRSDPSRPRTPVPEDAFDTHAHVFAPDGLYRYAARRPYTPAPATGLEAYRRMPSRCAAGASLRHLDPAVCDEAHGFDRPS